MEKTFDKCPACGSLERLFETLTNELKSRGLTRANWNFYYDTKEGLVLDEVKIQSIPIGSEVPVFALFTDICLNCGCIYTVRVITNKRRWGGVRMKPDIKLPPNIPPLNNPSMS